MKKEGNVKEGYDLDGVICTDSAVLCEDEARNATPSALSYPDQGIYIVTCRSENLREATEDWLRKHKIPYKKLVMMDPEVLQNNTEEEIVNEIQVDHKERWIKKLGLDLFVEDNAHVVGELKRRCESCHIMRLKMTKLGSVENESD